MNARTNPLLLASLLALVLALGLAARISSQYEGFRKIVNESLLTSEGYDKKFIDMVTHLEEVLTTRASFPYPGGKDPMTGRRREVAAEVLEQPAPRLAAVKAGPKAPPKAPKGAGNPANRGPAPESAPAEPPADKVRLTAIIADDYGQHTAIVMDGERSMSVDIGDMVGSRKVVRITGKELTMEDGTTVYTYGLSGSRSQQRK